MRANERPLKPLEEKVETGENLRGLVLGEVDLLGQGDQAAGNTTKIATCCRDVDQPGSVRNTLRAKSLQEIIE